jgi:hypothetical protein
VARRPIERVTPFSAQKSANSREVYWADSIGRRNTSSVAQI